MNNNQNNYNGNNSYNNYNSYQQNSNSYQQNSQPASPIYVNPQYSYNQQPVVEENTVTKVNGYGVTSILLAIFGFCCCGGLLSLIGLIVGIVGLGKYKKNILCIIGIVLCAIVLIYYVYSLIYTMQHPEQYQELMESYVEMLEGLEQAARIYRMK